MKFLSRIDMEKGMVGTAVFRENPGNVVKKAVVS